MTSTSEVIFILFSRPHRSASFLLHSLRLVGLLLSPGIWRSCSYLSRQEVGKAARVRHMATDAGQHVLGTMVAGSSGHRRTRIQMKGGQRLSGFTPQESRSQQLLFPCRGRRGCALPTNRRTILRAGEGGGGAWSSTGRGARPRMRPRRVQPSPRGGAHGAAPSSERPPAWGGEAAEKSHRDETRAPSLVGKKKKKNRRPLVKAGNQLSNARRICVGVVDEGSTSDVDHSSSLSLFGPNDPSIRCKPDSTASW